MAPQSRKARKSATTDKRILELLVENNHYLRENNDVLQDMDRILKDMDDKLRKISLSWSYR